MKQLLFAISVSIIFLQLSCGQNRKIDVSTITIDAEWTVQHNDSQTIDSIIILNTGKIIRTSGDSIYSIITHTENRRIDSLRDVEKKLGHPINSFSPAALEITHQSFTLNENVNFSVFAYDTTGNEVLKLINDKFSKGVYEVYFAIFSILKPGSYILAITTQLVEQYIKLKVI